MEGNAAKPKPKPKPKVILSEKLYNGLSNIHDIATDIMDHNLASYLKIYVLLYADDTVLLAESQTALNSMNLYCNVSGIFFRR